MEKEEVLTQRMETPLYQGTIKEYEAEEINCHFYVIDYDGDSSDDSIRIYLAVSKESMKIKRACFRTFAIDENIAFFDVMIELFLEKQVAQLDEIYNSHIEDILGMSFEELDVKNIIQTIKKEYKELILQNDDYLVCECARVKLGQIVRSIREDDLKTIEDITQSTKAGAFCKSCIKPGGIEKKDIYLIDILKSIRIEMEKEQIEELKQSNDGENVTFDKMSTVQRVQFIDKVLDNDIRPMLIMDGGNMEIIDIKENLPHYDLYIRYLGACSGCATGSTGTLYAIENILQQKIDENLRVLPI